MRRLWADSRPRGALFVLLSVGPVLAAGWARKNLRPNGLVVAHTAVTMWTVLGGAAAAALAAAAVGRSHSGDQRAPFVLIRVPRGGDVRNELRRPARRHLPRAWIGLAADCRTRPCDVRRVRPFPPTGADMTRSDHALAALEVDAFDGT